MLSPPTIPGSTTGRPRVWWLLAPVLATLAAGIHWAVNVPRQPVRAAPGDQGAPKKGARTAHKKSKRAEFRPRPTGELNALWDRYRSIALEDEPILHA